LPYPVWQPGMRITASLLAAMQPIEAIKTADQAVTNSTTLVDDSELFVPVTGGARYRGQLVLFYVAPVDQDIKYAWSVPPGSSGRRGVLGVATNESGTAVGQSLFQDRVSSGFGTEFDLGGMGGSHKMAVEHFILLAGADGVMQLRWAQRVAAADTSATVLANSHLTLWRVS